MINFTAMSHPLAGVLRRAIRLVPAPATMPVLQGPLRGARWLTASSSAGCWLGSYEAEVQQTLTTLLEPGDTFLDIGANVGFFTLLGARTVGDGGRVIAFEPLPANLAMLRRHVELNAVRNVRIIDAAVSDRTSTAHMTGFGAAARLDEEGGIDVRTVAIDQLWHAGEIGTPAVIKMDVEGAEHAALSGMSEMLAAIRPRLLIEFHGARLPDGRDSDTLCLAMLEQLGYRLTRLACDEIIATAD